MGTKHRYTGEMTFAKHGADSSPRSDTSPVSRRVRAAVSLLVWFLVGVAVVLVNKAVFRDSVFPFPVSLTSVHMLVNLSYAWVAVHGLHVVPRVQIPPRQSLMLALVFCGNITFTNVALHYVPVSFLQTLRASIPAFTIAMQYVLLRRRANPAVYGPIALVIVGVAMASLTEVNFHVLGFLFAIASCLFAAAHTLLSQLVLQRSVDPFNLLLSLAPLAFAIQLPYVLFFETNALFVLSRMSISGRFLVVVVTGSLSFLLNASAFYVLSYTSAISMNVAGNARLAFTILASVHLFRNDVSTASLLGCLLTLGGAVWYGAAALQPVSPNASLARRPHDDCTTSAARRIDAGSADRRPASEHALAFSSATASRQLGLSLDLRACRPSTPRLLDNPAQQRTPRRSLDRLRRKLLHI